MRKTEEMKGAGATRSHAASGEVEAARQGREGRRAERGLSHARMINP